MTSPEPPDAAPSEPSGSARRYGTARMEAFSDGVFAFAITLLVLDLVVPQQSGSQNLWAAFVSVWPQYLTYVISFATIGATWLAHNNITERLARTDSTFLRLNLLLLLLVAFMPFPTRFLSEYMNSEFSERAAVAIYGLSFLVLVAMMLGLWRYARSHGLLAENESPEARLFATRFVPGLAVYVVLIVIGLFVPLVAVFGYLAIALAFVLPPRRRLKVKHHG